MRLSIVQTEYDIDQQNLARIGHFHLVRFLPTLPADLRLSHAEDNTRLRSAEGVLLLLHSGLSVDMVHHLAALKCRLEKVQVAKWLADLCGKISGFKVVSRRGCVCRVYVGKG